MIQNKNIIIGLTGGIASGKSTVSNILVERGYKVIDADKISREIVEINKPAYKKIVEFFGEEILLGDKSINRKLLGTIIFSDHKKRDVLNNITHPLVFEDIKDKIKEYSVDNRVIFLDIPLLFEQYDLLKEHKIIMDEIWLVYVNKETQITRLMRRDNISKEEAILKIQSQMDIEHKRKMSSKIIDNNGDMESLREVVYKLMCEF